MTSSGGLSILDGVPNATSGVSYDSTSGGSVLDISVRTAGVLREIIGLKIIFSGMSAVETVVFHPQSRIFYNTFGPTKADCTQHQSMEKQPNPPFFYRFLLQNLN